ncbi:MAG: BCCT family transporter, partial [Actinomycetota bacterium]|nr:BCCT family transporter [Actinomycetota bacterium]
IWGLVMGAFAAILLVAGGLDALQQASILAALPFVFVILAMCVALYRGLQEETRGRQEERREATSPGGVPLTPATQSGSGEG